MKLLYNIKEKDTIFSIKDLHYHLRKEHNLKVCLVKDLKIGLKYIIISNNLLLSQIRSINFQELVLRNMVVWENTEEYNNYKNTIKSLVKQKEIYIKEL